jgi:hypothetical protein
MRYDESSSTFMQLMFSFELEMLVDHLMKLSCEHWLAFLHQLSSLFDQGFTPLFDGYIVDGN